MAKGYAIFTEIIRDQAGYEAYVEQALPTILNAGAIPVVFDDAPEVIEGEWPGRRTIVLEFPSVEAARDWYRSPEYQAVVGLRHAAADAHAGIVSGL